MGLVETKLAIIPGAGWSDICHFSIFTLEFHRKNMNYEANAIKT